MSLEKNIKNSLENFEMPYDNSAWESLSKRLDLQMPVQQSAIKKLNFKSLLFVASIISAIGVVLFQLNSTEEKPKNNEKIIANTDNSNVNKEDESVKNVKTDCKKHVCIDEKLDEGQAPHNSTSNKLIQKNISIEKLENDNVSTIISNKINVNDGLKLKPNSSKIIFPNLNDICQLEKIKIENTNSENLVIISPNNKQTVIESNKTILYNPSVEGEYQIGTFVNDRFVKGSTFNAKANPESEFIVDNENSFNEKGLPTSVLKSISNGIDYEWQIENRKLDGNTKEIEAHLFQKGNYTSVLTITHANGCKSKESKNIKITKDYNLLAVDAFEPSSINSKINTFIPYALTKREVRFTMVIFDINGNEVFKTNDANVPWNGVDPKTNEIAKTTSMYVWKVTLENPEVGEKGQYSGTIIVK